MKTLSRKTVLIAILSCAVSLIFAAPARAHEVGMSSLIIEFSEGALTLSSEYLATEIGRIGSLDDKIAIADLVSKSISISLDGKEIMPSESRFGINEGHTLAFQQVYQGIREGGNITLISFLPGKLSADHRQFVTVKRSDGERISSEVIRGANNSIVLDLEQLEPRSSFTRFLPIGIEHILFGYDHLLFLLALLLVVKNFKEIIRIVTSFTVAHSITLTLATLNVIQISPRIVEPLIALSIVFVGLENILKKEHKFRWLLTYGFGLVHGFGFASALREIGIGTGTGVVVPLVSFNLGVEIGQIAVVLLILPIFWSLHKSPLYASRIVPAGSVLVTAAGIYWFIERTLF